MTLNGALLVFFEDTLTIEPYTGMSGAQVPTYGAGVNYPTLIQSGARRLRDSNGKEIDSNVQAIIPDRVFVDPRSRVTLPSGFVPQQPPIVGVAQTKFQDLDSTMVML